MTCRNVKIMQQRTDIYNNNFSCRVVILKFLIPGEQEPDVNLTVLPSLTVPVLRPFSIICDAGVPRYSRVQLPPVGIIIYIGEHAVKKCNSPDGTTALNQCVYNSSSLFPEMPRLISCTAVNAERLCRFKTARITLDGLLIINLFNLT